MKITDILESLNFTTTINWNGHVGTFVVGDNTYKVLIRPATEKEQQTFVPFFDTPPKVGNVEFAMHLPSGETTQDLTGTSGSDAMKVFSVVAQAAAEQVKINGYEILLCIAKQTASPTNFENRVSAYETIVDRAARKAGMLSIRLPSDPSSAVYVVYAVKHEENISAVNQHLADYYGQ